MSLLAILNLDPTVLLDPSAATDESGPLQPTPPGSASPQAPAKPKLTITGPEEVEVGSPFELVATARDPNLGDLDFTLGVEWSVVPKGSASIEHGRGKALIPGPAVVTAIDRQLDVSATWPISFRPKRVASKPPGTKPMAAAARLVRIDVIPATRTITDFERVNLKAIGHYSDGSRKQITDQVEWLADPAGVVEIVSPGAEVRRSFPATHTGAVRIRAIDRLPGVESAAAVVTVRNGPVDMSQPATDFVLLPSNDPLELGVGDRVTFELQATLAGPRGGRTNVTSQVKWSSSNEKALRFEGEGVAIGTGVGGAEVKIALGGLRLRNEDYGRLQLPTRRVKVLGASMKIDVKLPPPKHASQKAAAIFFAYVVELAAPASLGAGGRQPPASGDSGLDALAKLAFQAVRLGADLKTLPQARQVWKAVEPRIQTVFKEAEGTPSGVAPVDATAARRATRLIEAFLADGLTKLTNLGHKSTPFGVFVHAPMWEKDAKEAVDRYGKASAGRSELLKIIAKLASNDHLIEKTSKSAMKSFVQQITRKTDAQTSSDSAAYLDRIDDIEKLKDDVDEAMQAITAAKQEVQTWNGLLLGTQIEDDARKKKTQGEEEVERVDHVLQHLIAIVKVSRAPLDPAALLDALDVIPGWVKHLNPNQLIESAERLMQQSVLTKSEALIAAAKSARIKLADGSTKLSKVTSALETILKTAERYRKRMEHSFDKSAAEACKPQRSDFLFADLEEGISLAKQISQLATTCSEHAEVVRRKLGTVTHWTVPPPPSPWTADSPGVIDSVLMDTARIQGDADRAATRANDAQQLRLALRKSAHELIESARDRQIEQAKKRGAAR